MPIDRSWSQFQRVGDFTNRHADKISQFDHLGGGPVFSRECIECFMHGKNFSWRSLRFDSGLIEFLPTWAPAAFLARFATGPVDENAPHSLCGRAKEVRSTTPLLPFRSCQL